MSVRVEKQRKLIIDKRDNIVNSKYIKRTRRIRRKKKTKAKQKKPSLKGKLSKRKEEYNRYLKSPVWAAIKIELYEHRGRKCEICGRARKLQVHHKHYKNIFNEEPEDLLILCDICHREQHKKKQKT